MPLDHPKLLAEAILQQNPVGFVLVNKVGQVIFVNEAASRLAWNDPQHTIIDAQSAPEVWGNAEDFDGRAIPVQEWPISLALRGIKTVGKELRLRHADGSHLDLSINASPLITEGVIIGAIASFIDITERRLAEQKVTAINKRLEEVATERARSIHLMHLIGVSANNVTDIREMFQIVLTEVCTHLRWPVGYAYIVEPPDHLFGISAWYSSDGQRYEALQGVTAKIHLRAHESIIGRVLKSRAAVFIPDLDKEEHFLRKNEAREAGLKSSVAIPIIVQKQPVAVLEFFQSEPIEFQDSVLQVMDVITSHLGQVIEQKRAERKLQALFDSAPDAQIVTDTLGHIVMANKQTGKLFGYAEDSLLGQPIELLVPADVRCKHIQHRAKYVATPHAVPWELEWS
jgi:PAS domain-containing protein